MKADDVERALVMWLDPRRCLIVPRVSWMFTWESDLIRVSQAGYLTEYEIKVSMADFRREFKKRRWKCHDDSEDSFHKRIRYYYMAVPESLSTQVEAELSNFPFAGAGLIVVGESIWINQKVRAKSNRQARPVTLEERYKLARLGTLKYWGLINKLANKKGKVQ